MLPYFKERFFFERDQNTCAEKFQDRKIPEAVRALYMHISILKFYFYILYFENTSFK